MADAIPVHGTKKTKAAQPAPAEQAVPEGTRIKDGVPYIGFYPDEVLPDFPGAKSVTAYRCGEHVAYQVAE